LRANKPRPHKPLAVMFPMTGVDGLDAVRAAARLDDVHEKILHDSMRPIVLVNRRDNALLTASIAPGLKEIGVFLPYSPLHHLLLGDFGGPLVATSANISGEPVLTDNAEVESRLAHVAQAFLHHNRPIARPADDPVYRIIADVPRPLRLGRGVAPLELPLPFSLDAPTLAVGSHMKNTIALAWRDRVVVSPHIGDLDSPRSLHVFEQVIADLQELYGVKAKRIVCDAHSGYAGTRWAKRSGLPVTAVPHHHAHAATLAGEFPDAKRWLVFTWDGVGLGTDGTLWGGEALLGKPGSWRRAASMRPFHLPGGEKAGREPWRSAAALCWECGIDWKECPEDTSLLFAAWQKRLNSPQTSAVGRLFDAAAALTGLHQRSSFEGQGPMLLEAAVVDKAEAITLPLIHDGDILRSDWSPLLPNLMNPSQSVAHRASVFHTSLAQAGLDQARRLRETDGPFTVGLAGGVFQNRILTEALIALFTRDGFDVRLGLALPCNDAGISYGQIVEFGGETTP
jgi:hydrogenase maturation protein HypF